MENSKTITIVFEDEQPMLQAIKKIRESGAEIIDLRPEATVLETRAQTS